jgi:hypothetical protein
LSIDKKKGRKKIIIKLGLGLQVILTAPVKLPGKAVAILKYIAVGIGIIETVIDEKEVDKGGKEEWLKVNDIRIGAIGGTLCWLWASISL